jgi:polyisoprenoid-binding protein YceI
MKELKISVLGLLILVSSQVGFTQSVKYSVSEETNMTVSGTSTLHDWTSEVNEVKGFVEVDENFAGDGKISVDEVVNLVSINVPVKSIISPRGATMDKKTYNALKSEQYPEIIFLLKDSKVSSVNGDGFTIDATGDLTIAGVTKHVSFR